MINSISQVSGNSTVHYAPSVSQLPPQLSNKIAAPREDTVVLSEAAQAKLLQQQGLTAIDIADRLGLSTSSIESDLGIAVTQTLTQAATA